MTAAWEEVEMGRAPLTIIDGDRGKAYPKHGDFMEDGYCLFLNATNVTSLGFDFSTRQFISQQKDERLRKGRLSRNDIVLTTRGTLGNVAYYGLDVPFEHIRINSGMVILRSDPDKLVPTFLYTFLRSPMFRAQVEQLRSGVAQPQLPIRDINRIKLPLPSKETQETIASIVSAYDKLIQNNGRRIALLEEVARLLYQEWFVHLRFPGHENTKITNGVPEGWEKRSVHDAVEILSGGTPKTTIAEFWDGDIPFYTPKDAAEGVWVTNCERAISEKGLNNCNSQLYPKDTIFISARGTVGKLNLAQRPMAMSQSCYALIAKEPLSQLFAFCAMRSAVEELRSHAVGAVFDAIVVDTFKRISFLVPESSVLSLFDELLRPIFNQLENLTLQNEKVRSARDHLLPRLMSGVIQV